MNIEICYVYKEKPVLLQRSVALGTSIAAVLQQLSIMELGLPLGFFEPETLKGRVGIFGKVKALETMLKAGDRIEIYDPLWMDPKEARRLRAIQSSPGASRTSHR